MMNSRSVFFTLCAALALAAPPLAAQDAPAEPAAQPAPASEATAAMDAAADAKPMHGGEGCAMGGEGGCSCMSGHGHGMKHGEGGAPDAAPGKGESASGGEAMAMGGCPCMKGHGEHQDGEPGMSCKAHGEGHGKGGMRSDAPMDESEADASDDAEEEGDG